MQYRVRAQAAVVGGVELDERVACGAGGWWRQRRRQWDYERSWPRGRAARRRCRGSGGADGGGGGRRTNWCAVWARGGGRGLATGMPVRGRAGYRGHPGRRRLQVQMLLRGGQGARGQRGRVPVGHIAARPLGRVSQRRPVELGGRTVVVVAAGSGGGGSGGGGGGGIGVADA